jgi:hypothetical protein
MRRTAYVAALGAAATLSAAPAHAEVALMSTGTLGTVELLTFTGDKEAWPTDLADVGHASVQCEHLTRGHRAVFAGALVWATDATPGMGNDWQYVRVTAGDVDDEGRVMTGETSPFYPAYDDRPATLPALSVILPDASATYTPLLTVQVFDSTYDLVGASVVGSQAGAQRVGDAWQVLPSALVRCR